MQTKDIRKLAQEGAEVAVIPRGVIQQHSGIRAHGAMRARIAEVYDQPRQGVNMRYSDEKVIARVVVTEDSRASGVEVGTEYEVSARRIIGSWAEREQTLAADRVAQDQYRAKLAQDIAESEAKAKSLNERQCAAGLVCKPAFSAETKPYVEFEVNYNTGVMTARAHIALSALVERLLGALAD